MFYVLSGRKLLLGLLVILAAVCLLWLVWSSFDLGSSTPSGGIVLWPKWMQERRDGEINGKPRNDAAAEDSGELEKIPEQEASPGNNPEPDAGHDQAPGNQAQFTLVGGELVDEYLPANPVYGDDYTLAVPTAGMLSVSVQPLSRRESFSEFRWERDRSRSRQLETLQGIITDSSSSEEQRLSAQERLLSIMAGSEIETELEGLLMAQGLPDAVVVLSDHGVTVMVDTVLTEEEAARIGDTVSGMTGISLEKIRILDHRS
ncbi:MAG TPA: SpoIIIAH-like family protein [Firmicutes bacterium]|nr:SpoIIIAH-like family protein [Bacillota bacterium]